MKGDRERCLDAGMDDYLSKPIQGKQVMEVIRRTLSPSPDAACVAPAAPLQSTKPPRWSWSAATQRRCERSRICASPRRRTCSTKSSEALTDGRADALSAAAHALRGMYLVFGPNEVVTIAGRLEELAIARDLTAAAVAYEVLRPAADRLMTALRSPADAVVPRV